jgi:hypothetical protein
MRLNVAHSLGGRHTVGPGPPPGGSLLLTPAGLGADRRMAGDLAVRCERRPDLRHHAGMGDLYRTADGWAVEVVELCATPDGNDGERLKVTYYRFFVESSGIAADGRASQ